MARDVGGVSAKSPLQAGKPLLTVKPSHLGTLEWAMPGLQEKFTCFQEGTGSTVMEPESKLEIPGNTSLERKPISETPQWFDSILLRVMMDSTMGPRKSPPRFPEVAIDNSAEES